ncbi:MAG: T9SS type A sorting domain-containing protein [Bacteroidales bacterium]|jgi:hypothetical protein|nr:T9SS type A sorting domain-containing protein [Bacteroidales bacterium]
MKKLLILFVAALVMLNIGQANAQVAKKQMKDLAAKELLEKATGKDYIRAVPFNKSKKDENGTKIIMGSVTGPDYYIAGRTFDMVFECDFTPVEYEYVDGISLTFPTGVTVNSATDFDLEWNGETGNGITTSWGDMAGQSYDGLLYGVASWTVNVTIDASFTGNMNIDWYAAGDGYSYYGTSDDEGTVTVLPATGTDLAIVAITPESWLADKVITPKVELRNMGATDISTYSVTLVINNGTSDVYTSTFNGSSTIQVLSTYIAEMPDTWTPATGEYTMTATLTLTDDDQSNNTKVQDFKAGYYQEFYAGNVDTEEYQTLNMQNYQFTPVSDNYPTSVFPMGEEFIGDYIYRLYSNNDIGIVTPFGYYEKTGTITGTPTGPGASILSIAYDWTNDVVYALVLNSDGVPAIYSLNMETYAATIIGQFGTTAISVIAMDMASDGYLYAPSRTTGGSLYKIDTQTGLFELVGVHGISINYGQDVTFDYATGRLYSLTCGTDYLFGYYDITTGLFVTINDLTISEQYATFVSTNKPIGPYVSLVTPEDNSLDQEVNATISATFTVDVTEVDFNLITIIPTVTGWVPSINNNVLTIAHDDLEYNTQYTVTIGAGSVSDGTDNLDRDYSWTFKTKLDPTACNDPSNLDATDIEFDQAVLSWTENGPATEWYIKYGTTGFDVETAGTLIDQDVTNPYTLTGLTEMTQYDFYVKSVCGVSDESDWAGPYTFTTAVDCSGAITFPFTEDFEDDSYLCWTAINNSTTNTLGIYEEPYEGTYSWRFSSFSTASDYNQYLISPELPVTSLGLKISFYYAPHTSSSAVETFKVGYSTTTNDISAFTWGEEQTVTGASGAVTYTEYLGTAPVGTKFVAINYFSYYKYYLYIDNISIEEDQSGAPIYDLTNEVSIYPNPSSGLVNILVSENSVVKVIDMTGRIIETHNVNAGSEVSFTQSAGMYFVKVENNNGVSTHKVIIE